MTTKTPSYTFGTTVKAPFEETMSRVIEALKQEGFGVLTTIDVQATMKAKLQLDFERYTILGACNPQLAHRALEIDYAVGALLPCNVVVHEAHEGKETPSTRVEIADPVAMLSIIDNPAMYAFAQEARIPLQRVLASLQQAA
ncbi:DUF302 domain-containing protein [Dictyobacter formicarum]|uniref:DUF302 domain-containing protein n=1 Tax=Dictyobacter formicarum TaxID=2778368 RepID=A0ABQ3VD56_9CHLR|nr:DUF302 domain-containing protein [Dictyobacter formicarum]GHO84077.1 hypothetical protein KSZ_20830 [Dictyobacter formicarum]